MNDYATGEAQWLMEPNHDTTGGAPIRRGSSRNVETENASCWIAVFVLLIFIACGSIAVAFYDQSIHLWPTGWFDHHDASQSGTSRRDIAQMALQSLNANMTSLSQQQQQQQQQQSHCQLTVLLLRHCDDHGLFAKDDPESGDKHCSHLGFERTRFLPTLFGTRWPRPQALYALVPPPRNHGINYRQIETLLPLAEQEDLPIHVVREPQQMASAIFQRLLDITSTPNDSRCHNSVTVVAWKHAFIPNVAATLGCGPDQGCPDAYPDDSFDLVWELQFVLAPKEPKDEIMDTLKDSKSSFLILQDDYGLLQTATEEEDNAVDSHDSSASSSSSSSSSPPQWTVYGSVTEQRYDPLAFDYLREQGINQANEMDL